MASCWASRRSASTRDVGVSSDATVVCVRDSQAWKSSRSLRKPWSLEASPNDSSRRFMVDRSSSHTSWISASRPLISSSCSGCSDANFSASERRSSSLPCGEESRREWVRERPKLQWLYGCIRRNDAFLFTCIASRSLSIPVSLRCRAMTPARSFPRLCVDSMTLVFSFIQLLISLHSRW